MLRMKCDHETGSRLDVQSSVHILILIVYRPSFFFPFRPIYDITAYR